MIPSLNRLLLIFHEGRVVCRMPACYQSLLTSCATMAAQRIVDWFYNILKVDF